MAEEGPPGGPLREVDAGPLDSLASPPPEREKAEAWPEDNPLGIARMAQSPDSFRRGETAPTEVSKPANSSPDAGFSDPTLATPARAAGEQLDADPPADTTTEESVVAVDLLSVRAKLAGRAAPLVTLATEDGEEPAEKTKVETHRVHSRSRAQEEATEARADAPPPPPEPRNFSQFVAVIIILCVLNVPAIMVLHRYMTTGSAQQASTALTEEERMLTPEDLASITDEMWARSAQAESVLLEWKIRPEEYSRLLVEVTLDPEMKARYEAARRTGPRGERKADLTGWAAPEPSPKPSPDPSPDPSPELSPSP